MTDVFTRLSVSDSLKSSSNTFKTCKKSAQYVTHLPFLDPHISAPQIDPSKRLTNSDKPRAYRQRNTVYKYPFLLVLQNSSVT